MNELMHYGVKGMKWGVRRYQNKDGSLTKAGKKHISKEYKKAAAAGDAALSKRYSRMQMDSYNKVASEMNKGGLEKYNKSQEKKYGKNYMNRDRYEADLNDMFDKKVNKLMAKSLMDFRASNESYRKADALVKQYGMTDWDELAKSNQKGIDAVRKMLK